MQKQPNSTSTSGADDGWTLSPDGIAQNQPNSTSTSGADDGWTLSSDRIAQNQPNASDASGSEKHKEKWHDAIGIEEILKSNSVGYLGQDIVDCG
jgi:hypothetical protein